MIDGTIDPNFWRVADAFERQLKQISGGAALCVYYQGEPVVDIWGGVKDKAGNPWKKDTLALSFSTTKGVTTTLLHVLADRGLIDYEEPIASYWPEFDQQGKGQIKIRHLLCHEAGLYNLRGMISDFSEIQDWKHITSLLAASKASHRPGKSTGYHALTYGWLLGELIERVTHKSFMEVLDEELVQPLDLDGLYIGLPPDQMHRLAEIIDPPIVKGIQFIEKHAPKFPQEILPKSLPLSFRRIKNALLPDNVHQLFNSDPEYLSTPIPAANGVFTARSLAKLYAVLAGGGRLGNVKLLSQDTLSRVNRVQSRRLDRVIPVILYWRMGYHSIPTPSGFIKKAFGHLGLGGSGGWADPIRNLSVGMTLSDRWIGSPITESRIVFINGAIMKSIAN
ncbi:serine hydrolase domain-containing protein [Deltaproteobacteria bacterium TL4]